MIVSSSLLHQFLGRGNYGIKKESIHVERCTIPGALVHDLHHAVAVTYYVKHNLPGSSFAVCSLPLPPSMCRFDGENYPRTPRTTGFVDRKTTIIELNLRIADFNELQSIGRAVFKQTQHRNFTLKESTRQCRQGRWSRRPATSWRRA